MSLEENRREVGPDFTAGELIYGSLKDKECFFMLSTILSSCIFFLKKFRKKNKTLDCLL